MFAVEPRDISLLFVLFYIAMAAGDFNNLINTTGGAQEKRIVGGSQRISLEMAKQLGKSRPARAAGADDPDAAAAGSRSGPARTPGRRSA